MAKEKEELIAFEKIKIMILEKVQDESNDEDLHIFKVYCST